MVNVYFKVIDDVTLPIVEKLRTLRLRSVKLWFNGYDNRPSTPIIQIRDKGIIDYKGTRHELRCFSWELAEVNVTECHDGLAHMMSRKEEHGTEFVCIDNMRHGKNCLVLFQDAEQESKYPKEFVRIPCFCCWDDLFNFFVAQNLFAFSLDNPNRFKKTMVGPIQGAAVYRDVKTGLYWYLDMLHKTHYEVFDSTGKKHIGEADLLGNVNKAKADSGKKAII